MPKSVSLYMIKDPEVVLENNSLHQIMKILNETGLSHLLVNDQDNSLVGVISKEDILFRIKKLLNETTGKSYNALVTNSITASDVMTKDPVYLKPSDSLDYAVELLLQREFHCLPVVKDKVPIGILTSYDLLKAYYQEYG